MASHRMVLKREHTKSNVHGNGNAAADDAEVACVAYGLYEQRGREDGHDLEDWLKAETIVRERCQPANRIVA